MEPHFWFSLGTCLQKVFGCGERRSFFLSSEVFRDCFLVSLPGFSHIARTEKLRCRHTQLFVRFVGQSPRFAVLAAAWFLCCYTGRFVCVAIRQVMCRSGTCCAGFEESEGRCHIVKAGAASSSSSAVLWAAGGCLQS